MTSTKPAGSYGVRQTPPTPTCLPSAIARFESMISAPSAISHLLLLPPDPILNEELIFHALSAGTVPSTAKLSFPLGSSTTREVTPAASPAASKWLCEHG